MNNLLPVPSAAAGAGIATNILDIIKASLALGGIK